MAETTTVSIPKPITQADFDAKYNSTTKALKDLGGVEV